MSPVLRGRRRLTVAEYAKASGLSDQAVRRRLRDGQLRGVDLNAGTGKTPRWRVYVSSLRQCEGG